MSNLEPPINLLIIINNDNMEEIYFESGMRKKIDHSSETEHFNPKIVFVFFVCVSFQTKALNYAHLGNRNYFLSN